MRGCLAVLASLALWVAPAQAIATPQDVSATHAFIHAHYALARISVAGIGASQAKIERFNASLAHECPRVGAGSLQDEAAQTVAAEVVAALWSITYRNEAGPIRAFLATVGHLRWSNPAITRLAERYANDLRELATMRPPDLCGDVRSWRSSGFQALPATTVSLVRRVEAIEPKSVPPRLLAPYERGADAALLAATQRLEMRLEEAEFSPGQDDVLKVLTTLSLNE
jgi:hypothetical protein